MKKLYRLIGERMAEFKKFLDKYYGGSLRKYDEEIERLNKGG